MCSIEMQQRGSNLHIMHITTETINIWYFMKNNLLGNHFIENVRFISIFYLEDNVSLCNFLTCKLKRFMRISHDDKIYTSIDACK